VGKTVSELLDRIVEAESPTVISAYGRKIDELERDKLILAENIAKCGTPAREYDEVFQISMEFLQALGIFWKLASWRTAGRCLTGLGRELIYSRESGFQPTKYPCRSRH